PLVCSQLPTAVLQTQYSYSLVHLTPQRSATIHDSDGPTNRSGSTYTLLYACWFRCRARQPTETARVSTKSLSRCKVSDTVQISPHPSKEMQYDRDQSSLQIILYHCKHRVGYRGQVSAQCCRTPRIRRLHSAVHGAAPLGVLVGRYQR